MFRMTYKICLFLLWLVATVSSFTLHSNSLSSRRFSAISSLSRPNPEKRTTTGLLASFDDAANTKAILCELQTFLRLVDAVPTGGMAKTVIQAGDCKLNGQLETRRAKKLYAGDVVQFENEEMGINKEYDVVKEVAKAGYVYKPKVKKVKPEPKVMEDGELEFGGRFRSEEWRKKRQEQKAERKRKNAKGKKEE
jgi:ribosome-associated protein